MLRTPLSLEILLFFFPSDFKKCNIKDYSIKNMTSLFEIVDFLKLWLRTGNRKAAYKKVIFYKNVHFDEILVFSFRKSFYQKYPNRYIICWPTSVFSPWLYFVSSVKMKWKSTSGMGSGQSPLISALGLRCQGSSNTIPQQFKVEKIY